jgi:ribonucleoside-diphosphate reductase alpha chain
MPDLELGEWAQTQYLDKYSWHHEDGTHEEWPDTAARVVKAVLSPLGWSPHDQEYQQLVRLITERKFIPGGRYLATAGRDLHQVNNCFLYRCEDSREGWADLVRKSILALSTGGGIGVVYSDVREEGALISSTRGVATGPLSPVQMVNECARHIMSGGYRRSAVWGGLHWWHPDVFKWIEIKDWSDEVKAAKERDYNNPAPLDSTNISVILDDEFFSAMRGDVVAAIGNREQVSVLAPDGSEWGDWARRVYWQATEHMLQHGEPGFSIDVGENRDENLRNACTEITSADDSDVCNLGSINLARIEDLEEMELAVKLGTLLLIGGTEYSDIPHEEVRATRSKNRRIGLGLMGVHEWQIQRGYKYEMVPELRDWLELYRAGSEQWGRFWARKHGLSEPVKFRAIAPNGTIGIVAQTTTSAEPMLFTAYKRRFKGPDKSMLYQYVLDPTALRMKEEYGVDPDDLETAFDLAHDPRRRVEFQADMQDYVDHGISSTINLPEVITDTERVHEFGDMLLEYLPRLRGITCYPNGARAGQPITPCTWFEAETQVGETFVEDNREEACASGVCGV